MSMTPEDRDLFLSLRREQTNLQESLARLNSQLDALEARTNGVGVELLLPPIPQETEPLFPPIPEDYLGEPLFPPLPSDAYSFLPPVPFPPAPPPAKPSLEFHFGRWLTRIGGLCGIIALGLLLAWPDFQQLLGHVGMLAISALVSIGAVIAGERLARKGEESRFVGGTLTLMALAWLYLTAYAACYYEPLRVIESPLIAGLLMLLWSVYALLVSERKRSQTLGVFAITLAYVSTAINPLDRFTMAADLVLAGFTVLFLLRNGWAVVAIVGVIGTYVALLHRLVIDSAGDLILDTSRTLHFLPHAVYLVAAWTLFTVGVLLTRAPNFHGAIRHAVVSLNNFGVAFLLTLTAYIAGYGASSMGCALLGTGLVFLVTSRFAEMADIDPVDLMAAYAAQGLALVTAGIIVVFTGVTRAVVLLVETFLLGIAGAFSGDRILTISTYVTAAFATIFALWEMAVFAHHPWFFGFGGAAIMLMNAWGCRSEVRHSPMARSSVVVSCTCYCVLAISLIFTALFTELSASGLPPALALVALALTFAIYYVSLFELPPVAQTLLIAAQLLVIFPSDTGEELPWWSTAVVAAVTLILVTWWSRQRVTIPGTFTTALTFVYALALVGMATQAIQPYLDDPGWLVGASLLSIFFLLFGTFTRVWSIAAMGQAFLAVAVYEFFFPPGSSDVFPWNWLTAAVPIVVVFATSAGAKEWLRLSPELPGTWRMLLRSLVYGYQLVALAMLARWVFAIMAPTYYIASFLFLGTFVLLWSKERSWRIVNRDPDSPVPLYARANTFGIRCSYVLTLIGLWLYVENFHTRALEVITFVNGLAFLELLLQPALLRFGNKAITAAERWILTLLAVGAGWLFTSAWALMRISPGYLTMSWALYALFLFLFGLVFWERRIRWCGLGLLLAAILRVFCYDFWGLSNGYKVLTFIVLAIVTLSLGYVLARMADRKQSWL